MNIEIRDPNVHNALMAGLQPVRMEGEGERPESRESSSEFDVAELLRSFEPVSAEESESAYTGRNDGASKYEPDTDVEVEEDESFEIEKFQVVRTEFFYNRREPSVTFSNYKIGFSTSCVRMLPQVDYVKILINSQEKKLAIQPCDETELHSLRWCNRKNSKAVPRQVTGKIFFMKLCSLMNWNPDYRYRILGKLIYSNGNYLFVFDLTATEMYMRIEKDGQKPHMSRKPIFPEEWRDQFGLPYEEHRKALQVNILDDFLVYGIRDKSHQNEEGDAGSTKTAGASETLTGEVHEGGEAR